MGKKTNSSANIHAFKQFVGNNFPLLIAAFEKSYIENALLQFDTVSFGPLSDYCQRILRYRNGNALFHQWASDLDIMWLTVNIILEFDKEIFGESKTKHQCKAASEAITDKFTDEFSEKMWKGPYEYTLSIPLPHFTPVPKYKIPISSHVSLKRMLVDNESYQNPSQQTNSFSNALAEIQNQKEISCLEISCSGLVGFPPNSPLIINALNTLKHTVMLGVIFGLLEIRETGTDYVLDKHRHDYISVIDGYLSNSLRNRLPFIYNHALSCTHLTSNGEDIISSLSQADNIHILDEAMIITRCLDSEDTAYMRIKASLEWLFDCNFMQNTTNSFVMLCLAIESMIGDNESKNKKEVLASRLSFSIGKTYNERKIIHDDFVEFYNKRSSIVHGSEKIMNNREIELLGSMKHALVMMIRSELTSLQQLST